MNLRLNTLIIKRFTLKILIISCHMLIILLATCAENWVSKIPCNAIMLNVTTCNMLNILIYELKHKRKCIILPC